MKAIETEYGGYRFRSRLEARWAIVFDAMGFEWEHEPEGFKTEEGEKYLPDFKLKNIVAGDCLWGSEPMFNGDLYVEVKGNYDAKEDDYKRYLDFVRRFDADEREDGIALLVVTDIPQTGMFETYKNFCYWMSQHRYKMNGQGGNTASIEFSSSTIWFADRYTIPIINKAGEPRILSPEREDFTGQYCDGEFTIQDSSETIDKTATAKAYMLARTARFEYGETPTKGLIKKRMSECDMDWLEEEKKNGENFETSKAIEISDNFSTYTSTWYRTNCPKCGSLISVTSQRKFIPGDGLHICNRCGTALDTRRFEKYIEKQSDKAKIKFIKSREKKKPKNRINDEDYYGEGKLFVKATSVTGNEVLVSLDSIDTVERASRAERADIITIDGGSYTVGWQSSIVEKMCGDNIVDIKFDPEWCGFYEVEQRV